MAKQYFDHVSCLVNKLSKLSIHVLQVATSLRSVQAVFLSGLESGAPSDMAVNTSSHVILEPKLWL